MLNIVLLGLVSFFSDISAEMVYPLIPLYLTSKFGATPVLIGIIEGIAESVASLIRVFSGYISDRSKKKKAIAATGYSTGILYKLLLILSSSWGGVLFARVIDRIGKGIRTSPRDVLVSESADKNQMGKAFGIHKSLDMTGSAIGIIIAYFLIAGQSSTDFSYKKLFMISAIPAVIGIIIIMFVKEKALTHEIPEREHFWRNIKLLSPDLKLYLLVAFMFTLGNSSNAFLLLKAKSVGFTDENVVLLYFLYNITAAILSIPFGKLSDKIGRKKVLVAGYLIFCAVYLGFAFATTSAALIATFALYGFFTAMTAGVERALISEIAPKQLRGTMLGTHSALVGIALLPASIIAGLLWNTFGPVVTFSFGAFMSGVSAVILIFLLNIHSTCEE